MKELPLKTLNDFNCALKLDLNDGARQEILQNIHLFQCPTGGEDTPGFHSSLVDKILGMEVIQIEKDLFKKAREMRPEGGLSSWGASLHDGNQTWVGLAPETLQTPYSELRHICELLNPGKFDHFVDLGAGYGRFALVLEQLHPEASFTGFEFVEERVNEGQLALKRLNIEKASLLRQDLTDPEFKLPEADFYFIYDYGKIPHIRNTIAQLEEMGDRKDFKVIARGRGVRSIIENEHPWLSQVHSPHHEENFSIYSMSL